MTDTLSKEARSERMSRIKGQDTHPELAVRKFIHAMGYRYRLHQRKLPGNPDIVFTKKREVIFVHGCFWHRHPDPSCKLSRLPKSRLEFWIPKFEANVARDRRNEEALRAMGWGILTLWECELSDHASLQFKIESFLHDEID
jgi:DNA mismatch endonuclease (patch repair protein)